MAWKVRANLVWKTGLIRPGKSGPIRPWKSGLIGPRYPGQTGLKIRTTLVWKSGPILPANLGQFGLEIRANLAWKSGLIWPGNLDQLTSFFCIDGLSSPIFSHQTSGNKWFTKSGSYNRNKQKKTLKTFQLAWVTLEGGGGGEAKMEIGHTFPVFFVEPFHYGMGYGSWQEEEVTQSTGLRQKSLTNCAMMWRYRSQLAQHLLLLLASIEIATFNGQHNSAVTEQMLHKMAEGLQPLMYDCVALQSA